MSTWVQCSTSATSARSRSDHNMFGLTATGLMSAMPGVNSLAASNVHTLALQVPIDQLTRGFPTPTNVSGAAAVIGVWTTASRQRVGILGGGIGGALARALCPGIPAGQPAHQRVAHRDRAEGFLEQTSSRRRQAVCLVVQQPAPRPVAPGPLPGCLPKPGPLQHC